VSAKIRTPGVDQGSERVEVRAMWHCIAQLGRCPVTPLHLLAMAPLPIWRPVGYTLDECVRPLTGGSVVQEDSIWITMEG
jgi:hypothetical protein